MRIALVLVVVLAVALSSSDAWRVRRTWRRVARFVRKVVKVITRPIKKIILQPIKARVENILTKIGIIRKPPQEPQVIEQVIEQVEVVTPVVTPPPQKQIELTDEQIEEVRQYALKLMNMTGG
ncbi:uncharacterized protein LOC121376535 [Gigantopelta aegis]|uniref:uncharacterized protein LOC121376535 n=1 Tax=Gigantopelta aegis TaxID=1735272 RepID=UPI001B888BC6|nr:uncharacterized protein LOC121376535 [Gigantopelta aegis]